MSTCMTLERRSARSEAGSLTRSFSEPCSSARVMPSIFATRPGIEAVATDSSAACRMRSVRFSNKKHRPVSDKKLVNCRE